MREAFGVLSTDWKEGINWSNVRDYRLKRAHHVMEEHGLGALLLFYDENMRYVSSTLTPGWNRLKPGLRYVVLPAGKKPIVYEQGDIGFHLKEHSPWIPKENIRHSYVWIKGAVGPAADQQVNKFVNSLLNDLEEAGSPRPAARGRFHRHQHDQAFRSAGNQLDGRHVPDDGGPGYQEPG